METLTKNNYYLDRYIKNDSQAAPSYDPNYLDANDEGSMGSGVDAILAEYDVSDNSYENDLGMNDLSGVNDGGNDVSDLQSHLQDIESAVQTDPKLKRLQADISKAKSELASLSGSNLSESRRESLLNDVTDILGKLDDEVAAEAPIHDLGAQLDQLKKDINAYDFPASHASDKQDLLKKIAQAQTKLDLNPDGQSLQVVQESAADIQNTFQEAQQNIDSEKQDALSSMEDKKTTLLNQIDNSSLNQADKDSLKSQVEKKYEDTKSGLQSGAIAPDDAAKAFDDLENQAGHIDQANKLRDEMDNVPSQIKADDENIHNGTEEIAEKINDALHSGDWSRVRGYLRRMSTKELSNDSVSDALAINQYLGVLFQGPAQEDENKLSQLLNLIPSDIRSVMSHIVGDPRLTEDWSISEQNKTDYQLYSAIPRAVASRLDRSIDWSKDHQDDRLGLEDSGSDSAASGSDNLGSVSTSTTSSDGSSNPNPDPNNAPANS